MRAFRSLTNSAEGSDSRTPYALLAVLAIAFALRLWGVNWGLPLLFHNDEGNEVLRALRLGVGDFEFQRVAKGGYFYLLFVEYGLLYAVLRVLGVVATPAEFGEYFVRDPTIFYLVGRTTTALIGAATVYLVYRLAVRAYSRTAGLWGAGLLAINVLHADLSHFIAVDVPMTCLAVASLYFAVRMVTEDRASNYVWAAFFAALATTTKITAILLLVPLLLAHFFHSRANRRTAKFYLAGAPLVQAMAVFLIAYVVTTPGIVTHFDDVVSWTTGLFAVSQDTGTAVVTPRAGAATGIEGNVNLFGFYADVLAQSMTWPVFMLCLGGAIYALVRRTAVDVLLLAYAISVYVAMSVTSDENLYYPRYVLPVVPVLTILGGRLVADLLRLLSSPVRPIAAVLAATMLAYTPVIQIASANALMTREDTRAAAKRWIEANVPTGAKIFIEGTRTRPIEGTVPLNNSPERLRERIASYSIDEPGKARYFDIERRVQTGAAYDLLTVSAQEELRDLQHYKAIGVEYLVLRPDEYPDSRRRPHWPRIVEQVRNDKDVTMVQRFAPEPGKTGGPLIEVYKVTSKPPPTESP